MLSRNLSSRMNRTVIHSLEGTGRFVIGHAADVKILEIANILRKKKNPLIISGFL